MKQALCRNISLRQNMLNRKSFIAFLLSVNFVCNLNGCRLGCDTA